MNQKQLAAVGEDMKNNKRKAKIFKANDGIGLCRYCSFVDRQDISGTISIGSERYYNVECLIESQPCYKVRQSLITCLHFKSPLTTKSPSLLTRLWNCFKYDDWTKLKE